MGKRGGSRIDGGMAKLIAKKLEADIEAKKEHDIAYISYNGEEFAHFGIRRGSHSDHPYIPKQLHISETEAVQMGSCLLSKDEYFKKMMAKGHISDDENGS